MMPILLRFIFRIFYLVKIQFQILYATGDNLEPPFIIVGHSGLVY